MSGWQPLANKTRSYLFYSTECHELATLRFVGYHSRTLPTFVVGLVMEVDGLAHFLVSGPAQLHLHDHGIGDGGVVVGGALHCPLPPDFLL